MLYRTRLDWTMAADGFCAGASCFRNAESNTLNPTHGQRLPTIMIK